LPFPGRQGLIQISAVKDCPEKFVMVKISKNIFTREPVGFIKPPQALYAPPKVNSSV
jgi:hypothetical protein